MESVAVAANGLLGAAATLADREGADGSTTSTNLTGELAEVDVQKGS